MHQFFKLNFQQKKWFVSAWIKFAKWHWLISRTPYKQWQHRVFTNSSGAKNTSPETGIPTGMIAIIEKAGRNHISHMNCLRRCMVTHEMLQTRGFYARLHFGVRLSEGKPEAHCWLTYEGNVINDSIEVISTYSELISSESGDADRLHSLLIK